MADFYYSQRMEEEQQTAACPHCGMPVYEDDWLRCPLCGEALDVSAGFISGLTKGPYRTVGIVLAVVVIYVLLAFLL